MFLKAVELKKLFEQNVHTEEAYKSSDDILGGSARNSYSGGASLGISGSMIVT